MADSQLGSRDLRQLRTGADAGSVTESSVSLRAYGVGISNAAMLIALQVKGARLGEPYRPSGRLGEACLNYRRYR
jgi:hypothetical protein